MGTQGQGEGGRWRRGRTVRKATEILKWKAALWKVAQASAVVLPAAPTQ